MEKEGSASWDRAAKTPVGDAGDDARQQAQESEATAPVGTAYHAAVYAEALRYIYTTEEELVEEYWQAGKLHRYDRRKEWPKHCARIARVHPPPKEMESEIAEYMKYLEKEEDQRMLGQSWRIHVERYSIAM